ncbi:MAG: rod shape-determining protein MreD [Candidatus Omnitrophica bacterium]|nr:rod shape-determining protein MreD [Candidatus Omnitrophota bacterium]
MAVLAILVWFELSLLPLFSILQIKPDLFLIFLTFYAFRIDWNQIIPLAFLLGIVQDLVTNSLFGLETASYVGGAMLLHFFAVRFDREKRWIQLASLFCVSWLILILFSVFSILMEGHRIPLEWVFTKTFLIAIYTTALGAACFPVFEKWLIPFFGPRQYELFRS